MSVVLAWLKERGIVFRQPKLYDLAMTHSSYRCAPSNQRLEFLGDAVLQLCVSQRLYEKYPKMAEGDLSRLRASIVCECSLAAAARRIDIGPELRMGKGELRAQCEGFKRSILADALEAIIGALYLDQGVEVADRFIGIALAEELDAGCVCVVDHKTKLQEWLQRHDGQVPEYRIVGMEGPPHKPLYKAEVWFDDALQGEGVGNSKKAAEQQAAHEALRSREEDAVAP